MNMNQKVRELNELRADMNYQKREVRHAAGVLNDKIRALKDGDTPIEIGLDNRQAVQEVLAANNLLIDGLREEIAYHLELKVLLKTETTE